MNHTSTIIIETIEYTFKREQNNKYWSWWNSINYLLNNHISLNHIQKNFIIFMLDKFDFLKVSEDWNTFYFDEEKIKDYEPSNLKLKLAEIENYFKTYRIIIKGASDYNMSIKSRGCLVELAKTQHQLKQTENKYIETQNKLTKLCEKLGIDPNDLK